MDDQPTQIRWQGSSRAAPEDSIVEVARVGDEIHVRNGKHPNGPVLKFTRAEWEAFTGGVEDGEFNLTEWRRSSSATTEDAVEVAFVGTDDGQMILVRKANDPSRVLRFTPAEWDAKVAGTKAGEFDF